RAAVNHQQIAVGITGDARRLDQGAPALAGIEQAGPTAGDLEAPQGDAVDDDEVLAALAHGVDAAGAVLTCVPAPQRGQPALLQIDLAQGAPQALGDQELGPSYLQG